MIICTRYISTLGQPQIAMIIFAAVLGIVFLGSSATAFAVSNTNIQFRAGHKSDELKIATVLAKELMNPLGVEAGRFIVAIDNNSAKGKNTPIGWAQIKPLGKATMQRNPKQFNARPGSYDLEKDLDDAMLDEFENDDSIKVPVGLSSLPWTEEYQEMEEAVRNREKRREELRASFRNDAKVLQLYELSSVYVEREYRGQGIGTELVRRVVHRRITDEPPCAPSNIYCLTLATTADWYKQNFGMEIVPKTDIPKPMTFEVTAGNIITKLIGAQLVCMQGTTKTSELCSQSSSLI